jgi:hypothetical protein
MEEVVLFDMELTKLAPTWRNKRIEEVYIAKILD